MNKPVAYAMFRDGEYYDAIHPDEQAKTVGEYDIPLYTHPPAQQWTIDVKVKELTDEDMYELLEKYQGIELCKAILRKAQER